MSRIEVITNPVLSKPLTADSRPVPGPLRLTSTSFIPNPIANFPASCAAWVAEKAEDFLEPETPIFPAEAQATVFPERSVIGYVQNLVQKVPL